ncbi:ABC transporter substrate-binding protein [Marinimicrococcus flavescens]|uniref:ABC transporter substrate-binding protein n=1 Tax=Marinimicrococcus flavescens TaxID=3031815 RepID=A0AAP3XQ97_9PROT|nr:ABC transporter substrate-binding protein [Marinimicrococcus flavescens]
MGITRRLLAAVPLVLCGWALAGAAAAADKNVTIVLPEEPDIVDPCHASRSNIGRIVKQNVAETLTEIDPVDGSVTPRLATSWEQVDEKTWRFELRQGVRFHDGSDFDAQAAVGSINRTLSEKLDCEIRVKFFGPIELTATAVGPHTLEVQTVEPSPIMPTMMGTMTIQSPKAPADSLTREPIGTGPYVFKSWQPGQNVVLERFDGYWGEQPEAEKATYIWRSESAVRAAMVATGEADIAPSISVQDASDPETDVSYFDSETTAMRIDVTRAPLDDLRIRKAVNLAIDRSAFIGTILSKDVVPATQLVVPGINGHNPELVVWPYDPEQARKLIAEAKADGVPVEKEIVLIGRRGIHAGVTEVMEAIHAMLQDVGLNVKLQMVEVAEWVDIYTKPYAEDRPPTLFHTMHDNNNGDAVFTVFFKYHSDGAQSVLSDEKLDELVEKATYATGEERRQLWQQAFARINDELVADVPLFHMVGYTRVSPRVNFTPSISTNSEIQLQTITFNE